ncbi:MAG: UDP-N-acetylglucosamine 2-epimerase (non-hydrolyzing) [Candidatus Rokubacteria bacterium]|nr:UDP-N-acetylglucosamine 2-epimerase (non-hydrolyzing) [Candidatus Rokubacteria bacterium]
MKVTAVVGARPNFVKIAPILVAARDYRDFQVSLVHTGQHYDAPLSDGFFRDLDLPAPDVNLGVHGGSGVGQLAEMMARLEPVLTTPRPDIVVVVGDVTSTLAGALAAVKSEIWLAHVEAGLRSFDRTMPEEINRVLTDAVSDFCFTTEPSANENLAREGISAHGIHYVGNVMIDTLFRFRERAATSAVLETFGVKPRSFAVLTLHRPSNVDDRTALHRALAAVRPVAADVPVIFPVHPRTRPRLTGHPTTGPNGGGLRLADPLSYLDFVQLMANAACVLTDSGGIQEETTALGVPCLTLRRTTERPITVTRGTNRVVGTDEVRIAAAWDEIRRGAWPMGRLPELWDGKAAERIVKILADECAP